MKYRNQLLPVGIVMFAVLLNILSAIILKTLANKSHYTIMLLSAGIVAAGGLNGLRFIVWGFLHKHYPLSISYPLSSLFYPMMLVVSASYGEPVNPNQILGTVLITIGVLWITLRVKP